VIEKSYFGFCETSSVLEKLDQWIRHRLRSIIRKQWKRGKVRFRKLCDRGVVPYPQLNVFNDEYYEINNTCLAPSCHISPENIRPAEVLEPFHNSCPLIIEPKDYEWSLVPAEPSHPPIDLVRTFPAEGMKAWRVAKLQGNGPHLLEPLLDTGESVRLFIAGQ